jgi:GNAT superfamily N-acetyltransferase
VDIKRVLPADTGACAEAVALLTATARLDCPEGIVPTSRSYAAALAHGWDGDPAEAYLARDTEGDVVGLLTADLPTYDNNNLAWFNVEIHPDHRGRGYDSALLAYGEDLAGERGRTLLGLSHWDEPGADVLARLHGFELKSVEVSRRQDLTELDWATVRKLYDEAEHASTDYELIQVTGALPEELLDGMVAVTESINDAPKDDLDLEDDVYTPRRLRAYEAAQAAREWTIYRVIARERATGTLAGHTTIVVERERPHLGHQHDTAVDRAHRGHRLGVLVKTRMLLWMREAEPALDQIHTWNAESNNHMVGINEQLGYRVIGRGNDYQKTI